MKRLSINGISLNFIEKNIECERTIIFLHGNSHSLNTFAKQMNSPLLDEYHLVFLDLPGHGGSSKTGMYSVKILAQSLAEFINSLKIKNFIVVGHSMGGHVAINLLKTSVTPLGLFLFGTPPLKNPFDVNAFKANPLGVALIKVETNYEEISILMDELNYTGMDKLRAIDDFLNTDPIFRQGVLDDITFGKNEDEVELIKSFEGQVIFLLATQDSMINNSYVRQECNSIMTQAEIKEIKAGHSPHLENDADFNQTLADFCNRAFQISTEPEILYNERQHERSQNEQRN